MDTSPTLRLAGGLVGLAGLTGLLVFGWGAGPYERQLFLRTLQLATLAAMIALPLSLALAVALIRGHFWGRHFLRGMLLAQLFFPLYLQAAAWEAGFGRLGWYSVGGGVVGTPWLNGMWGAVWAHAMAGIPWITLFLAVGLESGSREFEEAALLDEPPRGVWWRVVMPRLVPWCVVGVVWIMITAATDMTVADLYLVDTYPRVLYTGFALRTTLGELTWRTAGAILWLTQIAFSAGVLVHRFAPAGAIRMVWSGRMGPELLHPLLAGAIAWTWWFGSAVVPWGSLLFQLGRHQLEPGRPYWSPVRAVQVLSQGSIEFRAEIYWTLVIGGLATLVLVPLAWTLAWTIRRAGWWLWGMGLVICLLMAFPAPLLGLWLLAVFTPWHLSGLVWLTDQTVFLPVMAAVLRQIPWVALLAWFVLRHVPREQLEAADLERIPGWRQVIQIVVRAFPGASVGLVIFSLALSAGELSATLMVTPPGVSTVSTRIFGLIHAGVRDKESALAVLNILGCLGMVWWMKWVSSRSGWLFPVKSDFRENA